MKKEVVVGIFAHPDDESMGPGGTIAKLASEGEVFLITATRGEKGGDDPNLAEIRTKELESAAKILGIKEVFILDFPDGGLSEVSPSKLKDQVGALVQKLRPQTLLSFEPHGFTGHSDHIVISKLTQSIYERNANIEKLMLYCMAMEQTTMMKDYFIKVPSGYTKDQVDLVEEVGSWWEIKKRAIQAHRSQKNDVARVLKEMDHLPQEEFFLIQTKA